jgi:hypothetical protein
VKTSQDTIKKGDVSAVDLPSYIFRVAKFESGDTENGAPFYTIAGAARIEVKPSIV